MQLRMSDVWYSCSAMKKNSRRYHIRNWPHYITALINRGSISLWLDPHSIARWLTTNPAPGPGRPQLYSDAAIECALLIREVYHLPLRQTQGLISSLFLLLEIDLPVPHYSTLCRRARHLNILLSSVSSQQPLHILIDSTGLKVYGEGEWYVRLRKQYKRRTWRKLHIAVDHHSGLVMSAAGSHKDLLDRDAVVGLLEQVHSPLAAVYADGAYDYKVCYKAIYERGSKAIIPPKQRAVLHKQEWVSQEESGRDSIPQAEESLLRPSEIEANRRARRRDVNQVCGNEPNDYLGHARKLCSMSLGCFSELVYSSS